MPSFEAKRMSSPLGLAWLKSKKSLFSRTTRGKFCSEAEGGKVRALGRGYDIYGALMPPVRILGLGGQGKQQRKGCNNG